jgi:hypothetical protein
MDPNTVGSKVWFNFIDKVFIGFLAAFITFFFQSQQYQYQLLLNASVAASKINTDILLSQRGKLIEEMSGYSFVLDKIKDKGEADKNQIGLLSDHRKKITFIIETLGAVDIKIAEIGRPFVKLINTVNFEVAKGSFNTDNLGKNINLILSQYMAVLTTIQVVGIEKTVQEFQSATEQAKKKCSPKEDSPAQ